jgi:L-alanine-DL-glutamate epimerase-like enolase superfamily enzyme
LPYLKCPILRFTDSVVRISRITLFASPIALKEPFIIALGPLTHAQNVLVKVETESGVFGWGEASPFPTIHGETMESVLSIGAFLARHLLGADPRDFDAIVHLMDRCIVGNACAKSAFDIACHDLAARAEGLPLYKFLGAEKPREMITDYTISLGPIASMVEKAEWIVARGFPVIKIKLGGPADDSATVDPDVARVRSISRAVGPHIPLRLDANQGWSPERALRVLNDIADLPVQHCEAPIHRRRFFELPGLRSRSPIPIMADEACWDGLDLQRLIEIDAVDKINIKLSKSGGLHQAKEMLRLARLHQIPVQIGGFLESRLGFAAAAHLACTDEVVRYFDFDTPLMQDVNPIEGGIVYGPGGSIALADGEGLAATPQPEYLKTLRAIEIS